MTLLANTLRRAAVARIYDVADRTGLLAPDGSGHALDGDSAALARAVLAFLAAPRAAAEVRAHVEELAGGPLPRPTVVDELLMLLVRVGRRARRGAGRDAARAEAFEPHATDRPGRLDWPTLKTLAETDASRRLAKELKKRGFSFVGPTTAYAFKQAMGLVNDHLEGCAFRAQVEKERHRFRRPGPAD